MGRRIGALVERVSREELQKILAKPKRHKYGISPVEKRTDSDGIVFDSKGELERWHELKIRQRLGEISCLERQVKFGLSIIGMDGREHAIASYTADFVYHESGKRIVEDHKAKSGATRTESYRIKKRMMRALYGVEVTEHTGT